MASTAGAHRPPDTKATVRINYNGQLIELDYQPHEAFVALRQHALQSAGIPGDDPALGLFDPQGVDLGVDANGQPIPGLSAQDANVKPGEVLVLRRRAVGGGKR